MSSLSRTANRIQSSANLRTQFEKFCEMEFNDSQFTVEKIFVPGGQEGAPDDGAVRQAL